MSGSEKLITKDEKTTMTNEEKVKNYLEDLKKIVPPLVNDILKGRQLHISNFLFLICGCVEALNTTLGLNSKEKLQLAFDIIPMVLDILEAKKTISSGERLNIERYVSMTEDVILQIETLISVSNLPNILNERWKEIKGCCFPCLGKKK